MKRVLKAPLGQVCRLEDGSLVSEEGRELEITPYIRRRLRDGSLIDATPDEEKADVADQLRTDTE